MTRFRRLALLLVRAGAVAAIAACGNSTPNTPSGPPVSTNVITITSSGASPRDIQVTQGSRVLFVNNDNRSHNMHSDPHPEHTDCKDEFDQVGLLQPGQSRETGNLVQIRTCGFHDHDNPSNAGLKGSVIIR